MYRGENPMSILIRSVIVKKLPVIVSIVFYRLKVWRCIGSIQLPNDSGRR